MDTTPSKGFPEHLDDLKAIYNLGDLLGSHLHDRLKGPGGERMSNAFADAALQKTRTLRKIILADKHTLTEKEVERIVLLSIKFNRLTSDGETYSAADEDIDEEKIYPDNTEDGSDDDDVYSCLSARGSNDDHGDVGIDLRPFLAALDLLLESIFSSWLPGASLRDVVDARRTTPRRYPKAIAKVDERIMKGLEEFAAEAVSG